MVGAFLLLWDGGVLRTIFSFLLGTEQNNAAHRREEQSFFVSAAFGMV